MAKNKLRNSTELLLDCVFEAMHDKKAENILLLDLAEIKGANFDFFVIAHGNSTTQVNAIAEEVRRKVKTICHLNPAHSEGFANSEWILLDYLDVVVHIFQQEVREHYQIENLWADAIITPIEEEIPTKKTRVKIEPTTQDFIKKELAKKAVKSSKTEKKSDKKSGTKTDKKSSDMSTKKESKKRTVKKTENSNERKSKTSKSTAKSTLKSKSTQPAKSKKA